MNSETITSDLVSKIRSGKIGRDEVISRLYHDNNLRHAIRHQILKLGASDQDVESIFNTTLMSFIKTVMKNPDLKIKNKLVTYLCGIARYSWFHELKRRGTNHISTAEFELDVPDFNTPEKLLLDQSKYHLLHTLLQKLGKNCKEVLLHWANGFSMTEIAKLMKYKSDMMARKKKYKCFRELLVFVGENPDIKKALRNQ